MNTTRNFEENLTEMVFENKNKAYGAYAIRKEYHDNVTFSLILSSAFFGLLALLAVSFTNRTVDIPDTDVNGSVFLPFGEEVILQKPDKPLVDPPKQKVILTPKTESGVKEASDDPQKSDGKITDLQVFSKNPNPLGVTDSTAKDPEPKEPFVPAEKKKVVTFVDKMPFLKNMAEFIKENLKYPIGAKENGTEGTVYVTFVVETDGSITDIKLLKGIGDGCEQEAERVVGIMPLWEPGTLKEIPQRVQCNLPIRFRLK